MKRPLRSLLIGDIDHYRSEFAFGVNQGMTMLGHFHREIDIRSPIELMQNLINDIRPDIIWGHMLFWAPQSPPQSLMFDLCEKARRKGTKIVLHDGDAKESNRLPMDISRYVDLSLRNHGYQRTEWKIKQIYWPYFAFVQKEMAEPTPLFQCDLLFAGRIGGGRYDERTRIIKELQGRMGEKFKVFPAGDITHTLFMTPEAAVSANAILGYGRPDVKDWIDVRIFQYTGAGGIVIFDDIGVLIGLLEPYEHFLPYRSNDTSSIIEAVEIARGFNMEKREKIFKYMQAHHSCVARVKAALSALFE